MIPVRRLPGRPLVLVGVAASALLLGAGAAVAATDASAPSRPAPASTPTGKPALAPVPSRPPWSWHRLPHMPPWHFPALGAPFGALHGQFVVPKSGGGYQAVDMQRGSVTAVSSSSITVKSADGYTKTYQVVSSTNVDAQRDGISSVKTGHQVTIFARGSGSTVTAASILDSSVLSKDGFWRSFKLPALSG
jgi:hypothetical protein